MSYASYNTTHLNSYSTYNKGFVLTSTYFANPVNITSIEFVAVRDGKLAIELVKPICPDTFVWSSLTKICEKKSVTLLGTLDRREAEYACLTSLNKQYCSAEETCREGLTCPNSLSK